MGKSIDSIKMNFAADNQANVDTPIIEEPKIGENSAAETKEFEGVKIYEKDADGNIKWFDSNGKQLHTRVIEKIEEVAVTIPEFSETGAEQKGPLKVREVEYQEHGNENFQGERFMVSERQDYEDDSAWHCTTPKNQYGIVKFLREQNKQNG